MRLRDLMSGVVSVENTDGFPLETDPPEGEVVVFFGTGMAETVRANADEFKAAQKQLKNVRRCMSCSKAYTEESDTWAMQPLCGECSQ